MRQRFVIAMAALLLLGGCVSAVQKDFNRRRADVMYEQKRDYEAAAKQYLVSAKKGDAEASYRLGTMCCEEIVQCGRSEGMELLTVSASKRYAPAQTLAGLGHLYGVYNTKRSLRFALPLLEQAAEQNDGIALFHLGLVHAGVFDEPKNVAAAIGAFSKAKAGGLPVPEHALLASTWQGTKPVRFRAENNAQRLLVFQGQALLYRLGYKNCRPDGIARTATRAAVRQYQHSHGLEVTQHVTRPLVRELMLEVLYPDFSTLLQDEPESLAADEAFILRNERKSRLAAVIASERALRAQWLQRLVFLGLRQAGLAGKPLFTGASAFRIDWVCPPLRGSASGDDLLFCLDNIRMHEANISLFQDALDRIGQLEHQENMRYES